MKEEKYDMPSIFFNLLTILYGFKRTCPEKEASYFNRLTFWWFTRYALQYPGFPSIKIVIELI